LKQMIVTEHGVASENVVKHSRLSVLL